MSLYWNQLSYISIYVQFFWFVAKFAMERTECTFSALVCLEGRAWHSWVICQRWHHVMTHKPALTCEAALKLHSAPEDKLCCRGVHSFRFQAFQELTQWRPLTSTGCVASNFVYVCVAWYFLVSLQQLCVLGWVAKNLSVIMSMCRVGLD